MTEKRPDPLEREFECSKPWIAGIVNVTPDSFSGDGIFGQPKEAVSRGLQLLADGANLIDIGGESSRPGSAAISEDEELRRLIPVVQALSSWAFLSIDTYKAYTADRMLALGARMINDISALRAEPELGEVVARYGAWIVLMYSKENDSHPHATLEQREYDDVVKSIRDFWEERIEAARRAGIARDRIIVDPGMGRFISHDPRYCFEIMDRLRELDFGYPIMIGVSRKGFLGPQETRKEDSLRAELKCIANGAAIIRTHDPVALRAAHRNEKV